MSSGELSSARFINSLSSPCSCKIERRQPYKIKAVFFLLFKCGININRLQWNIQTWAHKIWKKERNLFRLVSSLVWLEKWQFEPAASQCCVHGKKISLAHKSIQSDERCKGEQGAIGKHFYIKKKEDFHEYYINNLSLQVYPDFTYQ